MDGWTDLRDRGESNIAVGSVPFVGVSKRGLELTVIFTTLPGTAAALTMAGNLTRNLEAKLTLLLPQVVPYGVPLNRPPVSLRHTRQLALSLVGRSAKGSEDGNLPGVVIQICLCRERKQCLERFVSAGSLVLIGGRDSWWAKERRLARLLRSLGHEVIFADPREKNDA